jgi:hypothetical protein
VSARRIALVVCFVVAALFPVKHARADSSEGGAFALPRYGARAWGMAGAVIARIDDESAVDWNPAGIARSPRSAGVAYVELVPGAFLTQSQAALVIPFGGEPDLETGVSRHALGAMYTNLSADVGAGETYLENHLRVAYAYSPEPLVTFAASAQAFISTSGVAGFDAMGTGIDMAGRLSLTRDWTLALVGHDVFSRYSYDDGKDYQKERQYVLGLARENLYGLALEANVVYVYGGWSKALIGAETDYIFDVVALRGGVAFLSVGEARTTYSFGVSARAAGRLFVHYGANLDEEDAFDTTHRFSVAVQW